MLPANIPDQQYILSLDSLDLSFLSQYVQRPANEKRTLWSKPIMDGESVYCEVQIPSDEVRDEESYIEPSETYMCHICKIDVPTLYSKQHNKSRRHQSFKKLTAVALENVLKQINIDIDYVNSSDRHDKFYCETCSNVILLKHKRQHNRSKYHLKSIENQKLAEDFIEIYVKSNEVDNKNKYIENEFNKNNKEYSSDSDTDWNFESDCEYETGKSLNQVIHFNNVLSKTSETPIKIAGCSKEIIDFQLYLKEMMGKYKLKFDLPTFETNWIVIVTPKGHKEKITIDAYHGYITRNDFVYCLLCSSLFTEKNRTQHSRSEDHVKNIIQPIDNNFIRKMIINVEGIGHCLICNTVENIINHIASSPKHKKYNIVIAPQEKETPMKAVMIPKTTFCDVCKIYIDTHNFSAHVNAKKHSNNLKLGSNNSTQVAAGSTPSLQSIVQNKDEYCDICKIYVPLGGMAFHMSSIAHKTQKCVNNIQRDLLECRFDNKLKSVDNKCILNVPSTSTANIGMSMPLKTIRKAPTAKTKYCDVCKINIDTHNFPAHLKAKKHKNKLKVFTKLNNPSPAVANIASSIVQNKGNYCEICKVKVPGGGMAIHITGKPHKNKCANKILSASK